MCEAWQSWIHWPKEGLKALTRAWPVTNVPHPINWPPGVKDKMLGLLVRGCQWPSSSFPSITVLMSSFNSLLPYPSIKLCFFDEADRCCYWSCFSLLLLQLGLLCHPLPIYRFNSLTPFWDYQMTTLKIEDFTPHALPQAPGKTSDLTKFKDDFWELLVDCEHALKTILDFSVPTQCLISCPGLPDLFNFVWEGIILFKQINMYSWVWNVCECIM